ncbi:SPARC-related modular calcium-binding protein 1-like isoform X1 [Hypanus sabinus]|uniref:SPARC-related modular calcium-binding protein 1-like isoform X1 n=1 Tax=Hypanus sabinus TaxID=79690 RepID=UPI0028C4C912|nr:SPARC-related modular calcium-binding protein 1-like isoform X1 [Hypanus sabinus]
MSPLSLTLLTIELLGFSTPSKPPRFDRTPSLIDERDQGGLCNTNCSRAQQKLVCGSDRKLYKSHCAFQRAKCRDPTLETVIRSRCSERSKLRCQEDRAQALAQTRKTTDSIIVPECNEDGTFAQVQCHKLTGYCWCVTPEGKPVSGSSVHNQTPTCSDFTKDKTSQRARDSSRMEQGVKLQANSRTTSHKGKAETVDNPRQRSADEKHKDVLLVSKIPELSYPAPWFLFIRDAKSNRSLKLVSCEQERRAAIEEAKLHQYEGAFVPQCSTGGLYKQVQCHQATGYCWCVQVDSGLPIQGTTARNQTPDCRSGAKSKVSEMAPLFRDRKLQGCPGGKKTEFVTGLLKSLIMDMAQASSVLTWRRLSEGSVSFLLEDRAIRWYFGRLDKDLNNEISEKELRPFKVYLRKNAKPRKCTRKFIEYCDLNGSKSISLHELKGCLGFIKGRSRRTF